jgi:hypothetical protein
MKKRALHIVGALVSAACLYYSLRRIYQTGGFELLRNSPGALAAAIGLASVTYALGLLSIATAWSITMAGRARQRFRFVAVYAVSQISKYLPGNVFQHIARFGLAVREGGSSTRVVATMTLESLVLVAVALVLALAALGDRALAVGPQVPFWMLATLGVVATIALATSRRKLLLLGREVLGEARSSLLLVVPLHLAFFALGGLGLKAIGHAISPTDTVTVLLAAGSFSAAWLAGFLTPGSPAGIGVREAVLLLLLGSVYAAGTAGAVVASFRLATVLGDVLLFGIGLLLARSRAVPDLEERDLEVFD